MEDVIPSSANNPTSLLYGPENAYSVSEYIDFETIVSVLPEPATAPTTFILEQNYPNPFNPNTTITFNVPQTTIVSLGIYNINGQLVKTLVDGKVNSGSHSILWGGRDNTGQIVSSGVYFYKLLTESKSMKKKMLFMN